MVERDNELKGTTFTISVLHISDGEPERIRQLLAEKVAQAPYFFNCAPLVINVSRLEQIPDFEQLKELVESEEFVLVGITGARSEEMKTAAKAVGLAVMASGKSRKSDPQPEPEPVVAPAAPVTPPEPEPAPSSRPGCMWARCAPASRFMLPAPRLWCWVPSVRGPKCSPMTAFIYMAPCVAEP
ncbi:hypothetical protein JUNP479_0379 [Aeromonas jandaei]|nr:hypothetical protein JUNP479_0379 [Aeromonas jandaei]